MRSLYSLNKIASAVLLTTVLFVSCKSSYYTKVASKPSMLEMNSNVAMDSAIVNYIQPYKVKLDARMNQVIGHSNLHLTKTQVSGQSLVGNFFADALLAIGQKIDPETQISFGTKGGIRAELKDGNITVGNIFEIMPFENYITILDLKGSQLITLAEFIAKADGNPISNMQLVIKDKQLVDFKINNHAVDPNKTYKLVTYDYLANGGDYVVGLENPSDRFTSDIRVREGLIDYIENLEKNHKTIDAKIDERIKLLN
ncbi:5'-nucleotidase C-terminal domain-containing protein [Sphingobacterium hungaricum]